MFLSINNQTRVTIFSAWVAKGQVVQPLSERDFSGPRYQHCERFLRGHPPGRELPAGESQVRLFGIGQ